MTNNERDTEIGRLVRELSDAYGGASRNRGVQPTHMWGLVRSIVEGGGAVLNLKDDYHYFLHRFLEGAFAPDHDVWRFIEIRKEGDKATS